MRLSFSLFLRAGKNAYGQIGDRSDRRPITSVTAVLARPFLSVRLFVRHVPVLCPAVLCKILLKSILKIQGLLILQAYSRSATGFLFWH